MENTTNNNERNLNEVKSSDVKKTFKLKKKTAATIILVIVVLAIILAVLNSIDYDEMIKSIFGDKYDENLQFNYDFYDPDYETDILKDESYLVLDRSVSYTKGAMTLGNVNIADYPGGRVIAEYLDSMIAGDAERYNSLFTDEYYQNQKNNPIERFPQQRVYNIKVTLLQEPYVYKEDEYDGKYTGITRYLFSVEYYIQNNTGTVRNDIPSDASRPIYIEVFEYFGGEMKINSMSISAFGN